MNVEERLRIDLTDRADDVLDAPADLFDSVVVGARRQRRRRVTGLALAACAAVAAVVVPWTSSGTDADGAPGDPGRSSELAGFERYPADPRGSLAGDEAYVSGLLERDWFTSPQFPDPPADTRQVLFAGEVPGGVMALLSGRLDGERTGLWLHGPAGAGPEELELAGEPFSLEDDARPISYVYTVDRSGALVVLARPGDTIEVSAGKEVTADGRLVEAPYEQVGDAEGVAVVDATALHRTTFTVRVTRDGQVVSDGQSGGGDLGGGPGEVDVDAALRGAAGEPDPDLVAMLVSQSLMELDLTADQAQVAVLWGGPIGNRTRPDATAVLLTIRMPSGATVLTGAFWDPLPDGALSGPCIKEFLPAGVTPSGAAMRCDIADTTNGANVASQLVVVPPSGTASVRLDGASGSVLDTRPVDGPAWVGPAPDGLASVTALDADGTVLAELPLGTIANLHD